MAWISDHTTRWIRSRKNRNYRRCFLRFTRSSQRLSSQRGTEASGGSAVVGKRCNGRCYHWFWEMEHVSKLRSGKKCNISFPVVLRHVLNYASGYCVVDVFYSGSRGEVEILYHFQRFRLLKEARITV